MWSCTVHVAITIKMEGGEEGGDFLDLLPLSKVQRNHMAGGHILKIYLLCGT